MLRIHAVCIELLRDIRPFIEQIEKYDRDQARQLRRSATSIVLNLAEGEGSRGGTRRVRYDSALGSSRETLANLQVAEALGYPDSLDAELLDRFDRVNATLFNLIR